MQSAPVHGCARLRETIFQLSNQHRAGLMQISTLDRIFESRTSGGCSINSPTRFLARFAVCAGVCLGWFAVTLFGQAAGPQDFGDAPPPYPTLAKENGARHGVVQGFQLGKRIDGEPDGQPDSNALGDDAATADDPGDEDGVTFAEVLVPGQVATVLVVASEQGMLDAWIDFEANGSWTEPLDQIFRSQPLKAGSNSLNFTIPPGAHSGFTFARFRFSRKGDLPFTGSNPDGEVEDYAVSIEANSPPTINRVDDFSISEDGGFQTVNLTGISSGSASEKQTLTVTSVSGDTKLITPPTVAYRSPNTTGALIFMPVANANGTTTITVTVDNGDVANNTTSVVFSVIVNPVNDPPTLSDIPDQAIDQDVALAPVSFSIGDVDNALASLVVSAKSSNQVLVPDNGITFGGSDGNRTVSIRSAPGQSGNATISISVSDGVAVASKTFLLSVNKKGSPPAIVTHPASQTVDQGTDATFKVEASGDPVLTYQWRFNQRALPSEFSSTLILKSVQANQEGNYDVVVANPNGSVTSASAALSIRAIELDFGDAPDPGFPTTLKNNGARHRIQKGFQLGRMVDSETDGQPNANATGDDSAPAGMLDDEDGVVFKTPLEPGKTASIEVLASETGRLDAWIDFNGNGSWAETGERIFNTLPLTGGVNSLSFTVPSTAKEGQAFARFRFSHEGVQTFFGPAPDGEVEDYRVQIAKTQESADLMITKDVSPNPVAVGGNLIYTLVVQNNGPGLANNVTVIDTLPPNVSYVSAGSSQGSCNQANGTVTCLLGNMGIGATANITIIVIPTSAIPLTNTACVSAVRPLAGASAAASVNSDPNPDNNCATVVTEVTTAPGPAPCDLTNRGTDFWLTFPGNYAPDPTNPPQITLYIVGPAGTTGRVEVPGLPVPFSSNFAIPVPTVGASASVTVMLPSATDLRDTNDQVVAKGVHLTASAEVAVFGMNYVEFTADSFLALPKPMWGREYIVLGYQNVQENAPELNGTQFAVVAGENKTLVTITPSVATGSYAGGVPFNITLEQGDVYQLRNTNAAPADLSGTIITSSKPVAVFGGHACASIPSSTTFFCNTVVEQLLPVEAWGVRFATLPLASRLGSVVRVVASQPGTLVQINSTPSAVTLNRGQWFEWWVAGPALITADKPVFAAQYSPSSDFDNNANADPFMVTVPPVALFGTAHTFCVPANGFLSNYVNVVVSGTSATNLQLDGAPVVGSPNLLATYAVGGGLVGFQVTVDPGAHRITAADPVAAIVYGYDEFNAYAHPAGMGPGCSKEPPKACLVLNCPGDILVRNSTAARGAIGQAVDFVVSATNTCGGEVMVSCKPPSGSLFPFGTTVVNCEATDPADPEGASVSCSFTVTVRAAIAVTTSPVSGVITLSWPLGATLQETADLIVPFKNTVDGTSPYVVQPASPGAVQQRFFRILTNEAP